MRVRIGKGNKKLKYHAGRVELFRAVGYALGVGLVVAFAAYGFLRLITPTSDVKAAPIDITRVALTVVAGVGGVVALVIAYRRQRDLEQNRFVERFGAAAAQLGATDVAVRIAGVYAMAGVADETDELRRQQCIDVLCGYLRLPYDATQGDSGRTKLVTTTPRRTADDQPNGEIEEHVEYRQNDREVRQTIVRVIADHLQPEAEYSWSTSNFDFRTAHLEDADFADAVFSGAARFDDATFTGTAEFHNATFTNTARFKNATFNGVAVFNDASFARTAWFDGVTFASTAWFSKAMFTGTARFHKAAFVSLAWFGDAIFAGEAWADGARFTDDARFDSTSFTGLARFAGVTFSSEAWFHEATFTSGARFTAATFTGTARFDRATFTGTAGFNGATFTSTARFHQVTFLSDARFDEARFTGHIEFLKTAFTSSARFRQATFAGLTKFTKTDFGSEQISFSRPRQWGPPPPVFDWDHNIAEKPANVEPQDWPPAVVPI
ncbi:pentapeptide repeat-containing protein [Nocardia abscessus]|uniref:pentapeptide repeat-containing protein n=2 Tax=Nocardia abscessus TaxID=120957 RepID=UPI002454618D|nr:pentapeptide repeat-containing protein [Nocardia abscessus]